MKQHYEVLIIVSNGYPSAKGRLPTRYSPVRRFPLILFDESPIIRFSLDLHVLGTPPAFILSQDQTLNKMFITHTLLCLYSVTRMTQSRHYCALNFRGLTSFACLSLFQSLSNLKLLLLIFKTCSALWSFQGSAALFSDSLIIIHNSALRVNNFSKLF